MPHFNSLPPLSKTAAQQMRVARSQGLWGDPLVPVTPAIAAQGAEVSRQIEAAMNAALGAPLEPRSRAIGMSPRQKAHAKRMERAAVRHDRLMASDAPGE